MSLVQRALAWDRRELAARFDSGGAIAPGELAGFAWRGVSLGLPRLLERLSWKTFAKVFVADGAGGERRVRGFNLRIVQDGVDAPYRPRARDPRFGELVARPEGERTVLDYGEANPWWHPLGPMRDVLVRLDGEVLLGRLLLALGPGLRLPTPSYFTLERSIAVPEGATIDDADRLIEAV